MAQIKYKGKVLAEIYQGQTLTLLTDGHELEGDLVIDGFGGGGEDVPEWDITSPDAYEITKGGNE